MARRGWGAEKESPREEGSEPSAVFSDLPLSPVVAVKVSDHSRKNLIVQATHWAEVYFSNQNMDGDLGHNQ
jgi:hypothetical protein